MFFLLFFFFFCVLNTLYFFMFGTSINKLKGAVMVALHCVFYCILFPFLFILFPLVFSLHFFPCLSHHFVLGFHAFQLSLFFLFQLSCSFSSLLPFTPLSYSFLSCPMHFIFLFPLFLLFFFFPNLYLQFLCPWVFWFALIVGSLKVLCFSALCCGFMKGFATAVLQNSASAWSVHMSVHLCKQMTCLTFQSNTADRIL